MKKMLVIAAIGVCVGTSAWAELDDEYIPAGRKVASMPEVGNPEYFLQTDEAKHLTQDQRDCVRDRTIFNKLCLGMPYSGVLAVMGSPERQMERQYERGPSMVLKYRGKYGGQIYVFFDNHKMTGWEKSSK